MDTPNHLESVIKMFHYYKALGEKAMDQLEAEQLFETTNEDTNSIAVIVKHLHGNMLSRWTDFLNSDGEKPWRDRDDEFVEPVKDKELVMKWWKEGWDCLFNALNGIKEYQLSEVVYIRNEGHTVMEAIHRQLAHYPYHIGQIVFYAKLLKKEKWNSLSIPKNSSKIYNAEKFSNEKTIRNFTDEEIKRIS